jgi:hypothetical protein
MSSYCLLTILSSPKGVWQGVHFLSVSLNLRENVRGTILSYGVLFLSSFLPPEANCDIRVTCAIRSSVQCCNLSFALSPQVRAFYNCIAIAQLNNSEAILLLYSDQYPQGNKKNKNNAYALMPSAKS